MNTQRAMDILGISDIRELNENILKQTYRALIKKNHPDAGGTKEAAQEVSLAYAFLKELLKKLDSVSNQSSSSSPLCVVTLAELQKIYSGGSIKYKYNGEQFTLSKSAINTTKVVIAFDVDITLSGNKTSYQSLILRDYRDKYSVNCRVKSDNISDEEDLVVEVGGKKIVCKISTLRLDLILNFDYSIQLLLSIERAYNNG